MEIEFKSSGPYCPFDWQVVNGKVKVIQPPDSVPSISFVFTCGCNTQSTKESDHKETCLLRREVEIDTSDEYLRRCNPRNVVFTFRPLPD